MTIDTSMDQNGATVEVGENAFRYRVATKWPTLPPDLDLVEVTAVATDSQDRVYVFNRGIHPVAIFSPEGEFIDSWGQEAFARAHGITIGSDDKVYCVDDLDHTVKQFSTDGQLLMTLGTSGLYSDTGATSVDYRNIQRVGPPFNFPTNLAISPSGDLYIADGYGNARIHHFSADGKLLLSWGEPGDGPGQFHIPHGIAIDRNENVYVADRENSRIQIFTADGQYKDEWNDVARPCEVFIDDDSNVYVAELGFRAGMWSGTHPPTPNATGGRMSIFNLRGELQCRWGGGETPCAPGDFFAPHDVWVDSRGDVYVSEVTMSAGGNRGLVSPNCHSLQKFIHQSKEVPQ
ncbi:peptidyl-alpha-hydroxyglycine alpha-amidating lyase family protein [Gimesia aquarii]|uniref:Serine/threonine-protein kinase PknD n=1 Tax=Gimesia aquarii TaxID=2527964 RepID=A0A517VVV0_9PLAN|nr:peptidyl-alpha-hydroxyglycine alpha-amidating lyase family protein [Gimesia aquarii]QDT97133.1 Serine/threonine-protein kinase PknD [Gimesia aquarii]